MTPFFNAEIPITKRAFVIDQVEPGGSRERDGKEQQRNRRSHFDSFPSIVPTKFSFQILIRDNPCKIELILSIAHPTRPRSPGSLLSCQLTSSFPGYVCLN